MFGAPTIVPQVGSDLLPLPRFHLTMTSGSVSLPAIDHPCDNSKGRFEVLTLYPKRLTIYQTQSVSGEPRPSTAFVRECLGHPARTCRHWPERLLP